jgi:signal transduction histidine kinase/ligand-binding sensor domain-containing protein
VAGLALLALAAGLRAERLPIRRFTQADGLVRDFALVVRQDSRGFLWIGTDGGVSRFDGVSFRNYGAADGLPEGTVADVLETFDGELLFATEGGVCRWRSTEGSPRESESASAGDRTASLFDCATPGTSEEAAEIRDLHQDRSGRLWAATGGGLFRVEIHGSPATPTFVRTPLGGAGDPWTSIGVRAIAEQPGVGLWIATALGVARVDETGRVARFRVSGFGYDERVFSVMIDASGRLWIGHVNDGLFVWWPPKEFEPPIGWSVAGIATSALSREESAGAGRGTAVRLPRAPGEAVRIGRREGLDDERVRTGLLEDPDGAIWIGTVRGLARYRDGRIESFGREHGLPDEGSRPSLVDRAGNVWLGSRSGGAARVKRDGFTSYDELDGLRGAQVRSIFDGRDGALVVMTGAERDFLQRFDGERFAVVAPALPAGILSWGWWVGQIAVEGRDGSWWLPSGLQGLLRYAPPRRFAELDGARPVAQLRAGAHASDATQVLYEDARGDLWIGSFAAPELAVRRGATGRFESFGAAEGVPASAPIVFREDSAGTLWIGFGDGTLGALRDGRLVAIDRSQRKPWSAVYDMRFDDRGALWVATIGGGLVRFERPGEPGAEVRAWTTADGLPSNEITCLALDARGRVWAGTWNGVARLDPESGLVRRFTTADGLANNVVRAMHRDRRGDLWFGTLQGLSRLEGAAEREPPAPLVPATLLTALEIEGAALALGETGTATAGPVIGPAGAGRVRIGFVAPSADLDVKPRYRYLLDGVDEAWSAPSAERAVTYAGLAPGRYRFSVAAVTPDGATGSPATLELLLPTPLWRRPWVLALYAALVLAAIYLLHRQRVARLLAVERVRTRIAADLHDDLGASLSRIAVLSEVAHRRSAGDGVASPELVEIAETARRITEEAGDIVWSIDPRQDDLASLLVRVRPLAADLLGERGVALDWSAPADAASIRLSPDVRRHLLLVLKEAVNNAARHARAEHVGVRIEASRDAIRVEIVDDGVGFDPAYPPVSAGGRGLPSLRARAAELGGRLELRSAPGKGTTVALEIPRRTGAA